MGEPQREKITFFISYFEAAQALEKTDRPAFYEAIFKYAFYGEEIQLPAHIKALFVMAKPYIDKSLAFSQKQSDNRKNPNKKSNNENSPTNTKKNKISRKSTEEENEEEKEEEKELEELEKRKRRNSIGENKFSPPTLEEVKEYCLERGNSIDPERFIDYYQANGWVQNGGKKIKDWRACVRTWERNDLNSPKAEQPKDDPYSFFV